MTVRWRIILPFAALTTLAAALLGWAVERRVAARAEADLRASLLHLARRLADPGVPLDASYLPFLSEVSEARILALGPRGEILFSSVPEGEREDWRAALADRREEPVVAGEAYLAAWASRSGIPTAVVAAVPRSRVTEIRREAAGPVRKTALLLGLASIAIGALVASSLTRPLGRLVEHAKRISAGDFPERIPVDTADEIGLLARTLEGMVESLRRAERMAAVGRISAGLAHEIRNPLSSIRMHVQLLGRRPGADVSLLLAEIDRLDAIVAELMAWAKPSPVSLEPVDLKALSEEALALMAPQLEHRGIRTVREYAGTGTLRADRERMRQVLRNLLANARDALGTGGTLTVRLGPGPLLEVSDDGPGIPEAIRGKVFEPFVTGRKDGTGLGLAIVKRAVEEQGGTVSYESSASGTTFRVSFA